MKTRIDREAWNRKEIFDFFSRVSDPFYAVSFEQEVTEAVAFARSERLSFYMVMVWLITKAMNQVENFRYAVTGDDIFLYDERKPSFTDRNPGSELFHIVTLSAGDDIREFSKTAKEVSRNQECFIDMAEETDDLIYLTCLPELILTGLTNEMDRLSPEYKDDTAPRIAWGKWIERDGRIYLNLSMEVNHRFIDGLHITLFSQNLRRLTAALSGEDRT